LEKNGFQVSSVAGSSIGSVVGGLYAMGKLPEFTEWVKNLRQKNNLGTYGFYLFNLRIIKRGERV